MDNSILKSIEWHDLPLESIIIRGSSVMFHVTPFSEENQNYFDVFLKIFNYEIFDIHLAETDKLNKNKHSEVFSFEYQIDVDGKISGEISIIPERDGWWKFSFKKAHFDFRFGKVESKKKPRRRNYQRYEKYHKFLDTDGKSVAAGSEASHILPQKALEKKWGKEGAKENQKDGK